MRISEFEYLLVSELITMPDRELAQKIELDIWRHGPSPNNERLKVYLNQFKASGSSAEFAAAAVGILDTSGLEFIPPDGNSPEEVERMGQPLCIKVSRTPVQDEEEYIKRLLEGEALEAK